MVDSCWAQRPSRRGLWVPGSASTCPRAPPSACHAPGGGHAHTAGPWSASCRPHGVSLALPLGARQGGRHLSGHGTQWHRPPETPLPSLPGPEAGGARDCGPPKGASSKAPAHLQTAGQDHRPGGPATDPDPRRLSAACPALHPNGSLTGGPLCPLPWPLCPQPCPEGQLSPSPAPPGPPPSSWGREGWPGAWVTGTGRRQAGPTALQKRPSGLAGAFIPGSQSEFLRLVQGQGWAMVEQR